MEQLIMIKKFKSPVDGLEFIYQIVDGQLSYKIERTYLNRYRRNIQH